MLSLIILAIGLAMDAVAVSLVRGSVGPPRLARAVEAALFFGIAQGLMPLIGWSLGVAFASALAAFDHWVAFALLGGLGLRMIWQAVSGEDEAEVGVGRSHYAGLAIAALATSIDAAVAGVTLPLLEPPVAVSCLVIAAVTAALSTVAYMLGTLASRRSGTVAEVLGGVVLIGLGTKILIEHLTG